MNAVQKLRQVTDDIRRPVTGMEFVRAWELAERLLGRMPVDGAEARRVCAAKDSAGLDALVSQLEGKAAAPEKVAVPAPAHTPEFEQQMESALRAFRKRLKVMRLADESKLKGRRLTSGKSSEIDAIQPPSEFPDEVWRALVAAGRLKDAKHGFYALP